MKGMLTVLAALFVVPAAIAQAPSLVWQVTIGSICGAPAVDSMNNVVAACTATGTNGENVFVVTKLSGVDGSLLWLAQINGDAGGFVVVDSNDDVVAAGRTSILGGTTVVKLAKSTGTELWSRVIDTGDPANAISLDGANDVLIAGTMVGMGFAVIKLSGTDGAAKWTSTLGSGFARTLKVNSQDDAIAAGATDIGFAVVAFSRNDGTIIWRQEIPNLSCCVDVAFSLALDLNDDVVAAGHRQGDFAVVKIRGNTGSILWSTQLNGSQNSRGDSANAVIVNEVDDVIVAGFLTNVISAADFAVLKLNGNTGALAWKTEIDGGELETDTATAVTLNLTGNPVATGRLNNPENAPVVKFASEDGVELQRISLGAGEGRGLSVDSLGAIIASSGSRVLGSNGTDS